jgi:hypothetical protein
MAVLARKWLAHAALAVRAAIVAQVIAIVAAAAAT